MTITTRLYTALFGQLVGEDQFGNKYYRRKGAAHGDSSATDRRKHETRWVIYKRVEPRWWQWPLLVIPNRLDNAEPSKVPPQWHGWLHYTHDKPPERYVPQHKWEKPPVPNLTGTPGAYVPPGHLLAGGERAPATSDYEAWKP